MRIRCLVGRSARAGVRLAVVPTLAVGLCFVGASQAAGEETVGYVYDRPADPRTADLQNRLLPEAFFAGDLGFLRKYRWPRPLTVRIGACGKETTDYNLATNTVQICLEDAIDAHDLFVREGNGEPGSTNLTHMAMTFVFLHEIGHALIGQFQLPTTGWEEDAADEYAAIVVDTQPNARTTGIAAAYWYLFRGQFRNQPSPWDPHEGDQRRSAHIACLVDGASPGSDESNLNRLGMTSSQEPFCHAVFLRQSRVWQALLRPYVVPGGALP